MGTTMKNQTLSAAMLLVGLLTTGALAADGDSANRRDNTPPPGFVALFNGKDLAGW
jgi:hypothetical protein